MEELTICTWVWGSKYPGFYVSRLKAAVGRHVKQPYRWAVFSPKNEDMHLTEIPGCFARLRMFDPEWQREHGITGRLVCMDLDTIITGPLDPLFDRPEPFVILHGGNSDNPCPYNGSLHMLRAGYRPDVWTDFSLRAARQIPFFKFPDDQGWYSFKIPEAAGWKVGENGIYCFQKPGWPKGDELPKDARLVAFPGWRDPAKFTHLKWIQDNWK